MSAGIVGAFLAALVVADRLTPSASRLARRRGFMARANPDVPTHCASVPLLGGLAIVAGMMPWIAVAAVTQPRWWAFGGALVALGALGAYKDRVEHPVSPAAQLAVQSLAASALWAAGFRIGLASGALDAAVSIGLAVAIVNAWNYIDIVDGLAASTAAAAAALFVAIGDPAAATVAAALAGGSLGYVRYNWAPASVFMGDLGSFAIGIAFAALALDAIGNHTRGAASLLAMGVPLADLTITTCVRLAAGRSPFRGGAEHVPLRLLARGWSPPRIAGAAAAVTLVTVVVAALVMR